MMNLTHTAEITEGKAMEAIFQACRANEARAPKGNVTFRVTIHGHEAALRDANGVVVALADVDQFDI